MGLDLLAGTARECLADGDLWIFDVGTPTLNKVWSSFFRDGELGPDEVVALREELAYLVRTESEALLERRGVRDRSGELRAHLVDRLAASGSPRLIRARQLHAFVARAASDGTGLRWLAD